MRPGGLHQHDRTDDVGVESLQPFGPRRVDAIVEIGAGDVDQEIDPPVRLGGRIDQTRNVGVFAKVGLVEAGVCADPLCHGRAAVFVDVGDDDPGAGVGKGLDDRLADQGGPAGDDRHFSAEVRHA